LPGGLVPIPHVSGDERQKLASQRHDVLFPQTIAPKLTVDALGENADGARVLCVGKRLDQFRHERANLECNASWRFRVDRKNDADQRPTQSSRNVVSSTGLANAKKSVREAAFALSCVLEVPAAK
jgi:hypothetical protein